MKQVLGTIGFAIILSSIVLLGNNFDHRNSFKLVQAEQEQIEIWILSRGFTIGNPHYVPQNVTAKIGTLIVWTNGDQVHHTVTSDEGIQGKLEGQIFDSGPIPPRSEFILDTSRLLDDVYPYHCTIHPWTRGMLTLAREPVSVAANKPVYDVGEKVTVYGIASIPTVLPEVPDKVPKKLVNATVVKSVSLNIFGPNKELFLSKEIQTHSGGKYTYTFTAGRPGVYTVKAAINSFTASTTFQVMQLEREKITTLAIKFEDEKGVTISVAKVGQQILIRTPIKNTLQASLDYTYIVQVKDANQVTVLLAWKKGSLAPLALSTPAIAWTPENEGTYNVEVFIWKSMDVPEPLSKHPEKAVIAVRK